jgi:hypothetical protein
MSATTTKPRRIVDVIGVLKDLVATAENFTGATNMRGRDGIDATLELLDAIGSASGLVRCESSDGSVSIAVPEDQWDRIVAAWTAARGISA